MAYRLPTDRTAAAARSKVEAATSKRPMAAGSEFRAHGSALTKNGVDAVLSPKCREMTTTRRRPFIASHAYRCTDDATW
jgi:hypothetical protein